MEKKVYLGDGLYAEFDGFQIRLYAERVGGTHEVFLEPFVLKQLIALAEKWGIK